MWKSSLCDYSDVHILVKGTITVVGAGATVEASNTERNDKQAIFKSWTSFTDCISKINNTQVDNVEDLDVVIPMYNLIKYSDNYSKTSGSLYQFWRDEPKDPITDSESFKFKSRFLNDTNNAGTRNGCVIKIFMWFFQNFWNAFNYCEINLILTWTTKQLLQ